MKTRVLVAAILMAILLTFSGIASAIAGQHVPLPPGQNVGNSHMKLISTYTKHETDSAGRAWTDHVNVYQVELFPKKTANSSTVSSDPTLPPIDATVISDIGIDSTGNWLHYYGATYADFVVTASQQESLWYAPPTGGSYTLEAEQEANVQTGTAVATPYFLFQYPDYGYWVSSNTFSVSAPGYETQIGTAYSPALDLTY